MTKECVAIKTGMLLKYADEPSWVIVSNDSKWTLGKLKKCLFKRGDGIDTQFTKRRRKREVPFFKKSW